MKLYCGTYAKYNEGSLKGEWVDLDNFFLHNRYLFLYLNHRKNYFTYLRSVKK